MWESILAALLSAAVSEVGKSMSKQATDITGQGGRDLNAGRSNALYSLLSGGGSMGASDWFGRAQNQMGQAGQYQDQAGRMANRSGADLIAELARQQPGMLDQAQTAATAATSKAGASLQDLAAAASAQARSNLERRLGSNDGFSQGGALQALSRGTLEPLLSAQAQEGQMYSNAFQNALSPLQAAATSREYNRPAELAGIAQGYGQLGSQAGSLGSVLAQLLGGQSEQVLINPQFQAPGQSTLSKLGDTGMAAALQALGRNAGGTSFNLDSLKGEATSGAGGMAEGLQKYLDSNPNMSAAERNSILNVLRSLGYGTNY